jgi:hypothetical protein
VLFEPVPIVQFGGTDKAVDGKGQNPATSPIVRVLVGGEADAAITAAHSIEIRDYRSDVVFARDSANADEQKKLTLKRGMNAIRWDYEQKDAKALEGMVLWNGDLSGPRMPAPGRYEVTLTWDGAQHKAALWIEKDPRAQGSVEDLQQRHEFVVKCRDAIQKAHDAIEKMRSLRTQMEAVVERAANDESKARLVEKQKAIADVLKQIEGALYQTEAKAGQDLLNFPIKLTDKLAGVMSAANRALYAPTKAQRDVADMLLAAIDVELAKFEAQKAGAVAEFNALARELETPYVK